MDLLTFIHATKRKYCLVVFCFRQIPSSLPFFLTFYLRSFLTYFLPSFLPSFLPFSLPSFITSHPYLGSQFGYGDSHLERDGRGGGRRKRRTRLRQTISLHAHSFLGWRTGIQIQERWTTHIQTATKYKMRRRWNLWHNLNLKNHDRYGSIYRRDRIITRAGG